MRLTDEGKYDVTVANAYLTESQKGTLGIVFEFECPDGEMECTRWVTEKTTDRVWQDLETLGFYRRHADDIDNLDRIGDITRGHQCQIVCEYETYNGTETLKVKWINPIGAMRSSSRSTKAGLHALLTGNSITGPAEPRQEPAPHAPIPDDDLPF